MSRRGSARQYSSRPAAVYRRAGVNYVTLKDGTAVVVQPGESARKAMEILSGLTDGDVVVTAMKLGLSGALTRTSISSPLTPLFLLAVARRRPDRARRASARGRAADQRSHGRHPRQRRRLQGRRCGRAGHQAARRPSSRASTASSTSTARPQDDRVMVTARFLVGTKEDDAILRVHEKIRANIDRIPVGIPEPLIVGRGINDVADRGADACRRNREAAERWTDKDLYRTRRRSCSAELIKVDNVGLTYIAGGSAAADPRRARSGEALAVRRHAAAARRQGAATPTARFMAGPGPRRRHDAHRRRRADAAGLPDIGLLLITTRDSRPVYVKRRRQRRRRAEPAGTPRLERCPSRQGRAGSACPAVSLALAKRAGANAVVVAEEMLAAARRR